MASIATRRKSIPGKDATADEVKAFLDTVLDYSSSYRIRLFRRFERSRLYFQGDQWIEPDWVGYADPLLTPFWKPMEFDASNWQPTPVLNKISMPVRFEASRLVSVGANPYIRPDAPEPRFERAAKVGRDVLKSDLERSAWREEEYTGTLSG